MARVGVIDEVAEEVVNHKKSGIVGVYNKYRYDKEKEAALTKWEQLLIEILKAIPETDDTLCLSQIRRLECDTTSPFISFTA